MVSAKRKAELAAILEDAKKKTKSTTELRAELGLDDYSPSIDNAPSKISDDEHFQRILALRTLSGDLDAKIDPKLAQLKMDTEIANSLGEKQTGGGMFAYRSLQQGLREGVSGTVSFLNTMLSGDSKYGMGSGINLSDSPLNINNPLKESAEKAQPALDIMKGERGKTGQFAGDIAQAFGGLVPAIGASVLTGNPAAGIATIFASAGGQKAEEAKEAGASLEKQKQAAILAGGVEAGTEMLFAGIPGLGKGVSSAVAKGANKLLGSTAGKIGAATAGKVGTAAAAVAGLSGSTQAVLSSFLKTPAGQLAKYFANAGGEGSEEIIAEFLNTYVDRATFDPEAAAATKEELKRAFALGGAVSLILGVGNIDINKPTSAATQAQPEVPSNMEALESLAQPVAEQGATQQPVIQQEPAPIEQNAFTVPQGEGAEQLRGMAANTIPKAAEAGTVDTGVAQDVIENKRALYNPVSMEQSQTEAVETLRNLTEQDAYKALLAATKRGTGLNSTEMAAVGEVIKQKGTENPAEISNLLQSVMETATDMGRAINLIKTFTQKTPAGLLYTAKRQAQKWAEDMGKDVPLSIQEETNILALGELIYQWDNLTSLKGKALMAKVDSLTEKVSPDVKKNILQIIKSSKAGEEGDWFTTLAMKIVADKMPSSVVDKYRAGQRINLLFNIKTQLRNIGGNFLHALAENLSGAVGTGADLLLARKSGRRTTGLPKISDYFQGFKEGLSDAKLAYQTGTTNIRGTRYTDNQSVAARVFRDNSGNPWKDIPARVINWFDKTTSFVLDAGDRGFRQAMTNANYNAILAKNNGKAEQWMKELAERAGATSTFQQDSTLANLLIRGRGAVGRSIRQKNDGKNTFGATAADVLSVSAIPFAKTPANLLVQAVNYSPVGLINGIEKMIVAATKGKELSPETQRKAVDALGRGIVGSGLSGLGYVLASLALATGKDDDDKDKAAFDRLSGAIPNSIKLGDFNVDFSTMAPVPTAINIGASIWNETQELRDSGELDTLDILGIIALVLDAPISDVTSDSLWQGIVDFIETGTNDGENGGWGQALLDVGMDSAQQMVPFNSFLRAVAGAIDQYARETSSEGEAGWTSNRIAANIPFLSKNLPERRDVTGAATERFPYAETAAGRALASFLNPFGVAEIKSDDETAQAIYDLYSATGEKSVFPQVAPYSLKYDDKTYPLRGEDRSQYQETLGSLTYDTLSDLIRTDEYKNATKEEQLKLSEKVLSYAKDQAKADFYEAQGVEYTPSTISERIENLSAYDIPVSNILLLEATDTENDKIGNVSQENSGAAKAAKVIGSMDLSPTQKKELAKVYCTKDAQAALSVALQHNIDIDKTMDLLVGISNVESDSLSNKWKAQTDYIYEFEGLSNEEKDILSDNLVEKERYFTEPTDADYSSGEEGYKFSLLTESAQARYPRFSKPWRERGSLTYYPVISKEEYSFAYPLTTGGSDEEDYAVRRMVSELHWTEERARTFWKVARSTSSFYQ